MTRQHRVVAAIDFGTHGTGFAWAVLNTENTDVSHRRVNYFDQWEGQALTAVKNRSAVLRDTSTGEFVAWGEQAVRRMDEAPADSALALRVGFKMALLKEPNTRVTASADAGLTLADNAPDVYELIVHILREVSREALERITTGPYDEDDIRWCLTVPAMWDQYNRDLMFKAAVAAGLPDDRDRLILVPEPTAAALYCTAKGEQVLSAPGTRFLVVDAGGGTVDITSYQVDSTGRLDELALPKGEPAGSEYLNSAFMNEILKVRLGEQFLNSMLKTRRSAITTMMDSWERAKRTFRPDSGDPILVPLSSPIYAALLQDRTKAGASAAAIGMIPTEIVVSNEEATAIFDKVVDETIALVGSRLAEMRAASGATGDEIAVLVGGFAESPYLKTRLSSYLATQGVRLLVPERPSIAVLTGAVHFAYDASTFASWRAPFTCGVEVSQQFQSGIDPTSRLLNEGGQASVRRFDTFVQIRQQVTSSDSVTKRYHPLTAQSRTVDIKLLSCPRPDVTYPDEPDVTNVATINVDVSDSMHLPLKQRGIEVTMRFEQSQIHATARTTSNGKQQAANIVWRPTW